MSPRDLRGLQDVWPGIQESTFEAVCTGRPERTGLAFPPASSNRFCTPEPPRDILTVMLECVAGLEPPQLPPVVAGAKP